MHFPGDFQPAQAGDFIGPAARVAAALDRLATLTRETGRPSAHLFIGDPGAGKSALCKFVIARLTGIPVGAQRGHWGIRFYNGKNVNADVIRDLDIELKSRPMFGGWRVAWIDEVDMLTRDAQVLMLTLLEELPPFTIVLATSNEDFSGESKERRFQSRFQTWPVGSPSADEIKTFLVDRFGLGELTAAGIAECAGGDVRAALRDADRLAVAAA